ncbi:hypothetical protein [Nocardioides convexus]|uniref:hypothetical protein n=1 Tax=Nocardioides convexus TaxID=2712224 RepID=UPI0024186C34|nr:hypothetical protein [Nocardioides convexus]
MLTVEKDSLVYADTWNTPDFLGLTGRKGVWKQVGGQTAAGDGVVVGVIDSGIWPESRSFRGSPLTAAPQGRWGLKISGSATSMRKSDGGLFRGQCQAGEEFAVTDCNSKVGLCPLLRPGVRRRAHGRGRLPLPARRQRPRLPHRVHRRGRPGHRRLDRGRRLRRHQRDRARREARGLQGTVGDPRRSRLGCNLGPGRGDRAGRDRRRGRPQLLDLRTARDDRRGRRDSRSRARPRRVSSSRPRPATRARAHRPSRTTARG